ncbi:MAG: hypothetical protein IH591_18270 [Bacteroidales bacterium]|nr:hypothetical protein [Bacteroidales bacterium]
MRRIILFILLMVPLVTVAQISNDGKSGTNKNKATNTGNNLSILYSGATNAPFVLRVLYCEAYGGSVAFKSDFDDYFFISAVGATAILNNLAIYLGGGVDIGYEEGISYWKDFGILFETGTIIKTQVVTIEIGLGTTIAKYHSFNIEYPDEVRPSFFVNFGIGYSF